MKGPTGCAADASVDQRELLRQLLQQRAQEKSGAKSVVPSEAPASCAQRRLWFVNRLEGASPSYNLPCHIMLRGTLDVKLLEQSFNVLAQRHTALRTTFHELEGEPQQRIAPGVSIELPVVDVSLMPGDAARAEVKRLIDEAAVKLFDLRVSPLFRLLLARLSEREHVLVLVMHHIISDGWSMGVLMHDLFRIYQGLRAGGNAALPGLPISYLDYSQRQTRWLQGEGCANQLAYWKEHLKDLPTLALPTDRPRPAVKQSAGAMHVFVLDARLTRMLEQFCRRDGVTLFMFLLAAFSLLLSRYSGQSDIVVGSPIANRNSTDTEGLIGFFVNTLVMRTDLSGDPSGRVLLARAAETALAAYANQDVPFERLVEELRPERDTSRNPLFQVVMALQNEPMSGFALDGLEVGRPVSPGSEASEFDVDVAMTRFDLELHFWESDAGLRGVWFYDVALFDEETVAQLSRHLVELVRGIVADPDRRISGLDMLTTDERHKLLREWACNQAPYPRDATIQALFEQQSAVSPEAVALAYGDRKLSYAELNAGANQVARYLERMGVRPGALIGLCMERSAEMIIAMLGILKTGCAYVPLDPDYPAPRLKFMLEDTGAGVLLTQASLKDRLPEYAGRTLSLDEEWAVIRGESAADRAAPLGACMDLAYVIYTSGSTGEPKGVAVPHRAVVRLVRDTDYVQVVSSDRIVQASNASFDAATFEIWGALLNGACLVGISRDQTLVPALYAAFLRERKISIMFITTALFNQLARELPEAFSGLRAVLFGGEAVDVDCVRRVVRAAVNADGNRHLRLLHVYGPTESTTFASWYEVGEVGDDDVTVPIGRPIANTELYVLDRDMRPVPAGVLGELHVGGDGLARCYWQRPQLTDERFVPNPHGDDPSARLYRTGDLVRWNRAGCIEFAGRIDHQVKLRGFRIELGEIESRLKECAGVHEAIVILREQGQGGKQLVAYVVPNEGMSLSLPELKLHLQDTLPGFMVPSAIVRIETLPLTKNGKVDRKRLPEPELQRQVGADCVAPRTELEQKIVDLWRSVLGLQDVGIDDNFFDLGGDSFRLVRVHAGLQHVLGRDVSVTDLFRCSTVRALALRFGEQETGPRESRSRVHDRARKQRAALEQRRQTVKE